MSHHVHRHFIKVEIQYNKFHQIQRLVLKLVNPIQI